MSKSIFLKRKYSVLLVCIFLLAFLNEVFAGTTGKIVGKITDAQTGEPLPGANVIIEGTTLGASSDMEGIYIILNVPPGEYSVSAIMIGYSYSDLDIFDGINRFSIKVEL